MPHRVCPWWIGYLLASPVRRLFFNPAAILDPYIRAGMTVLEPGPGMGFFTLELARQVGPGGRVVAVDIQPKMLAELRRRADRAGLAARVDARLAAPDSMQLSDLGGSADFALAFAVVHEFPDQERFFVEVAEALKAGGRVLLAEPAGHVKAAEFNRELQMSAQAGLTIVDRPSIRRSHAALLQK